MQLTYIAAEQRNNPDSSHFQSTTLSNTAATASNESLLWHSRFLVDSAFTKQFNLAQNELEEKS